MVLLFPGNAGKRSTITSPSRILKMILLFPGNAGYLGFEGKTVKSYLFFLNFIWAEKNHFLVGQIPARDFIQFEPDAVQHAGNGVLFNAGVRDEEAVDDVLG